MENVLRAMDVIPPFDSHSASDRPSLGRAPGGSPALPMCAVRESEPRPDDQGVPTLDLGEKILAEQRRRTTRKRRAPGTREAPPDLPRKDEVVSTERLAESSGSDLTELQQLVSDIVARDIARLYEGVERSPHRLVGS